jgi:membrane protein implicated in regulation of membrane protease activity
MMTTWADFYLICFLTGFCLCVLSFLGASHWHFHLPHVSHAHGLHTGSAGKAAAHHGSISPFSFVTLAAFLAWFGGTGYLLTRYSTIWFLLGLGIAATSGAAGAGVIYFFFSKVLTSEEENLDPADYEMVGVLGRISVPIRYEGTGEIIYSQMNTRRTCGARSENGAAIPKNSEVVVTRYEKGIAYVRLWSEMAGEESHMEVGQGS